MKPERDAFTKAIANALKKEDLGWPEEDDEFYDLARFLLDTIEKLGGDITLTFNRVKGVDYKKPFNVLDPPSKRADYPQPQHIHSSKKFDTKATHYYGGDEIHPDRLKRKPKTDEY